MNRLPIFPYGIKISQTWEQVVTHFDLIEQFGVTLFVEVGVHHGGLAAMLLPLSQYRPFRYLGIEFNREIVDLRIKAEIIYGDCFNQEIINQIKDIIQNNHGPCYLFCDNGDKPREVKTYSPLLRPGDLISVHDYGIEVTDRDLECLIDFESIPCALPVFRR